MTAAQTPNNELDRLHSLRHLAVLDTAAEIEFDALVRVAATICGTPISLISLVDADRQWFKANLGLSGVSQTPRDVAFCAHAILQDGVFEVPDASADPRFADNDLVTGEPRIRFYAGAPLTLRDGSNVGTLCVIDRQAGRLSESQRAALRDLATVAAQALEGRRALRDERDLRLLANCVSKEFEETTAKFRALSESSPLGVFATDAQGNCIYTNQRWQDLYGLTAEQSLGDAWLSAIHPEDGFEIRAQWQKAVRLGEEFNGEFRILRPNGEVCTLRQRSRAMRDDQGRVTGFVGSTEDVTEVRNARDQLTQSEQRVQRLYRATPAMMHSIDFLGRLISVSDLWLSTLGYVEEEVLGRPSSDFLTEESRAKSRAVLQRFFAEGRCDEVPYQMVCRDGRVLDVRLSAVLERDASGQPVRSMAVIRDVTDELRAEAELLDEQRRLAAIIEGTGAATWQWNVQTGEIRLNERWAQIQGYTLAELEPLSIKSWFSGVHPEDLQLVCDLLDKHFAGEHARFNCESRIRHRDGHWLWVLDRGRVLTRTSDGKPEWMFGSHFDITDRRHREDELRKSMKLLNRTGEVAGIGGWELDLLTQTLTWSEQTRAIHGVGPDYEPTLEGAIDFYAPEAQPVIQAAVETAMATGGGWDLELPFIRADGVRIWVRAVGNAELEDGRAVRLLGAFQDITQRRALHVELAEQHELLRVTLKSIGDAVITTDAKGVVTWLNPVAERMTGWLGSEAKGRPLDQVFNIVNENTRKPAESPVMSCLRQGRVTGLASDTLLISRNGDEFGVEDSAAPIRGTDSQILGAVLVFHDVTEQRRLSGEMTYRATHDDLTGLVNRAEFETRLGRSLRKAREDRSEHALLYIDLDQFKLVNDACGHTAGDRLLQSVAKLLGESIRARDTLARLGGDEFAVILEHCSVTQANRVAQQICDRMDDFRFAHDDRRFRIGASIGLVPIDARWGTASAVLQAADASCYAAKEAGRNRVHAWFDTDQTLRARQGEMQWASRLEQALDENAFVLHAQRIEALRAQGPGLHLEVLLRMIDDDGSIVPPGHFMPAAERFHLASRIDRWVLRRSIDVLRNAPSLDDIDTLNVNLSGQSIGDRAFHRHALEKLADAGILVCQRLCLEVTETVAVTNIADASVFIDRVRALGVRVALDDFGAGASSFGYLKSLKVDVLKIDGQFIQDLIDDPLDDAAVRCFVDVARLMGLKTVAEFVDRPEILERVKEIGIDYAQGFLLHRPQPIEVVLRDAWAERARADSNADLNS